jgi:hypothetical protein
VLRAARLLSLTDRLVSFPFDSFEGSGCFAADRELGQMRTRAEPADEVTHELSCPTILIAPSYQT